MAILQLPYMDVDSLILNVQTINMEMNVRYNELSSVLVIYLNNVIGISKVKVSDSGNMTKEISPETPIDNVRSEMKVVCIYGEKKM